MTLTLFDLTSFYRLGQKYKNNFVPFLVQMKTLKFAFEIQWPLGDMKKSLNASLVSHWSKLYFRLDAQPKIQTLTWLYEVHVLILHQLVDITETRLPSSLKFAFAHRKKMWLQSYYLQSLNWILHQPVVACYLMGLS